MFMEEREREREKKASNEKNRLLAYGLHNGSFCAPKSLEPSVKGNRKNRISGTQHKRKSQPAPFLFFSFLLRAAAQLDNPCCLDIYGH